MSSNLSWKPTMECQQLLLKKLASKESGVVAFQFLLNWVFVTVMKLPGLKSLMSSNSCQTELQSQFCLTEILDMATSTTPEDSSKSSSSVELQASALKISSSLRQIHY
ncbi:unnamed protein product [Blepharisma stoltei]|uniref:Uncharacterized protein n=1 Tax=Blepharisma stoltei TaxID=1481888 RepID=A0AAU9KEE9_9CILI|nr:unnamed protein product [Blepharisma stoltei]